MKILPPLMTQSSPSRTARVRIARAGSLPPDGSVSAKKPLLLAAQRRIQIAFLLIVVGLEQLRETGTAEHAVAWRVEAGAMLRHLDRDQRTSDEIDVGATVLGRNVEPVEPHRLHLRDQTASWPPPGNLVGIGIEVELERHDLVANEPPHDVDDQLLLLGRLEVHVRRLRGSMVMDSTVRAAERRVRR